MTMRCLIVLALILHAATNARANTETPLGKDVGLGSYHAHPQWSQIFDFWLQDYLKFGSNLLGYSWPTYAAVAGSTIALAPYDQHLHDETKSIARKNRWISKRSNERKFATYKLFNARQSMFLPNSSLGLFWYLGDGASLLGAAGGFAAYGYARENYRSTHVAFQILESLSIVGPTVLAIKMATGREAPSDATHPGGIWHGFPGLQNYAQNQAKYYAFPSGHLSAAVSTFVVIAENYPELPWLVPFEGVLAGLLMYALVSVDSHWPSDYPMALLLGYTSAKTVVMNNRLRQNLSLHRNARQGWVWEGLSPVYEEKSLGMNSSWHF